MDKQSEPGSNASGEWIWNLEWLDGGNVVLHRKDEGIGTQMEFMAFARKTAVVGTFAALALGAVAPAFADTLTNSVNAGTLSAAITSVTPGAAVNFSASTQTIDSTIAFRVVDGRCVHPTDCDGNGTADDSSTGWSMSMQVTGLTKPANSTSTVDSFAIRSSQNYVANAEGQALGGTNGPKDATVADTPLGTSTKIATAASAYGNGVYTADATVRLNLPAYARPGNYVATVVVTTSDVP